MSNSISVAILPCLLPRQWQQTVATAVVIDTLRFTTTACQALAAGATQIRVAVDVDAARQMAAASEPIALLCGERHCRPIPGFDLGNSPLEFTPNRVGGRNLVFTTTNGTLAVEAALPAERIVLGSLVNCAAVAQAIAGTAAWIICSGTDGEVAGEDMLAAGAIIACVLDIDPALRLGNDAARLALNCYTPLAALARKSGQQALCGFLRELSGGSNLLDNGYDDDIEFACQIAKLDVVPSSRGGSQACFVV